MPRPMTSTARMVNARFFPNERRAKRKSMAESVTGEGRRWNAVLPFEGGAVVGCRHPAVPQNEGIGASGGDVPGEIDGFPPRGHIEERRRGDGLEGCAVAPFGVSRGPYHLLFPPPPVHAPGKRIGDQGEELDPRPLQPEP